MVALTSALVVAAPASADTVGPVYCSGDSGVLGATEATGQITYLAGIGFSHCGTLGVRANYTHVGGTSWTNWTHSTWGDGSAVLYIKNGVKSQHSTSVGNLLFTSYR
ncbi:hypothetical protein [Pseudactinotalea sp. HY158]|uniref:hypothetical protein n=1 Tax=Pseudactinotalea sp. HY158 TaxID=2654547 RepID=UPI001E32B3FB|nr:hypothetical protein [Pseudactinotalea sp. HY158]